MSTPSPASETSSSIFLSGSDADATISRHQALIHQQETDICTLGGRSSASPATALYNHREACSYKASDDGESWNSDPLIPSLPIDVALNILARIPRCYHPNLSLVSKPIKSFLSSPDYYTSRSLHSCKQHFLYMSIRFPGNPFIRFFTLNRNPNPLKKPHSSLIPVPPIPVSGLIGSAFASVDHRIVVIGGSVNDTPSPHVWSLDCRFHTWEHLPNMQVPREFAAAGVVDDKLYVMGGCSDDTRARSRNWAEVYDPKIGKWSSVLSPIEIRDKWMRASAVIDGKIYGMADRGGVFYDAKSGVWGVAEKRLDLGWRGRPCVIDGVLFCYDYLGKIRGYVAKEGMWKELKGLDKCLPKFLCGATMANVGGNLMVVWERRAGNGKEIEIWCAELKVESGEGGELKGKVQWSDVVLSVPNRSYIANCLAVDL